MRTVRRFVTIAAAAGVLLILAALLRILIGGEETTGYTSVVLLRFPRHDCTGTVVGTQMVLTAAHCGTNGSQPDVVVDGQEPISASTCIQHRNYTEAPQLDIALCRLPEPAGVVPHPLSATRLAEGGKLSYVGYGDCWNLWSWFRGPRRTYGEGQVTKIADNVIQVGKGNFVCGGDSGGPVFAGLRQERYPVSATISTIGPQAWPIAEAQTLAWLKEYQAELCFEGAPTSACEGGTRRRAAAR